ncbi:MAG: hypothetical protein RLY31_1983 [Bacteroidota bacterium]
MKEQSYQPILAALKKGQFRPVYFLHGAEPYFIDLLSGFVEEHALQDHEKAFNQTVLYGRDTQAGQIIDQARRYPMMAERQVVIVKEAQDLKDLKDLEPYFERPTPSTVLVLCHKHKPFNTKTKLAKAIESNGILFEAKKLYDNQIAAWIQDHAAQLQLKVDAAVADLLAEYLGTDLSLVVHELDKLAIQLERGATVSTALVESQIGISREYNVFELQKALAYQHRDRIFRITRHFAANPRKHPLVMVVASLASFFSRLLMYHALRQLPDQQVQSAMGLRSTYALAEYRAASAVFSPKRTADVIHLLLQYDLKSKGVDFNMSANQEGELLRELVWKVINPPD